MIALVILVLAVVPILSLYEGEEKESMLIGQRLLVANYLKELTDRTQSACIQEHFSRKAFEQGPFTVHIDTGGAGVSITQRVQFMPAVQTAGLFMIRVEGQWRDPLGVKNMVLMRMVTDPEWGFRHGTPSKPGETTK
jgi:hypothetical protein